MQSANRAAGRCIWERQATSFNPAEFDAKPRKHRGISDAGRARIAAAQKARWAKFKKAAE
jgi:hypothetical protein